MKKKALLILFVFLNTILLNQTVIAGVTYLGVSESFDTTSDNATPAGIHFNTDGTKVFVMGSNSVEDEVNEYSLTTAFDISTTQTITRRLGVGTNELGTPIQELHPYGITFNGDGTKLYISGNGGNKIYELDLGSAFNISSATLVGELATNNHANGDGTPCGITFNNDGTKLFLAGFANHRIVYWSLSTPYGVESAGTPGAFSVSTTAHKPRDVDFNSDGTKMYVVSGTGDHIAAFDLDSAFDLSGTVTHRGNFSVNSEDDQPFTMEFNSNGTKLFMLGYTDDKIHEYSLSVAFEIINTVPTLSSSVPADNATSVALDSTIVLNFSESVDAESGNITIKKTSDNSTVETIDVTSGQVTGSGTSQITITPSSDFDSGTEYYVLIDASAFDDVDSGSYAGISSTTGLSFTTVTTVSDPFEDKTVVALVEAQTKMPKRIVKNVSIPIFNRLQWMRNYNEDRELFSQGIKFKFSNPIIASIAKVVPVALTDNEEIEEEEIDTTWSFWSEGSVSVGKVGDTISSHSKDINTNGITIGLDNKVSDRYLYGYTVRYTNDDVDVGTPGTSLDTDGYSFSTYASLLTGENKFIEGIFGVSKLDLKNVRKSDNNILHGDRDGAQLYGSINYVTVLNRNNLNISPNIRLDISQTHLKGYTETGTDALSYDDQTIKNGALYTGINLNNVSKFNNINFVPNAGIELGLDFSPSSDVSITYVSDPNTSYMRSIDQQESKSGKVKLGFDIITQTGFSLSTLYERNQSENSHSDTFYLGTAYITLKETQYALSIQDNIASVDYIKKLNGFDLVFDTVYDLFSEHPEYAINLKVSSIF
tara:strand:- start:1629 stop:4091 length:2463 start_codon:yes stop_codon:yes gene_type:complete